MAAFFQNSIWLLYSKNIENFPFSLTFPFFLAISRFSLFNQKT